MADATQLALYQAYNTPTFSQKSAEKMGGIMQYFADRNLQQQLKEQAELTGGVYNLDALYAPQYAQLRADVNEQYAPRNVDSLMSRLEQADPNFTAVRDAYGKNVLQGLEAGYGLGDGLSRELEQAIRGAQTARGNYLGAAPVAQEAMGKGSAMIDLYNQRMSQANQFSNSRNAVDMFATLAGTTDAYSPTNVITPQTTAFDFNNYLGAQNIETQNRNGMLAALLEYQNAGKQAGSKQGGWMGALTGALGGAATGASAGAVGGPWGAVIGGVVGAGVGGVGGYFAEQGQGSQMGQGGGAFGGMLGGMLGKNNQGTQGGGNLMVSTGR